MLNIADLLTLPELRNDLSRVDDALRSAVASSDPLLNEVASHLILAGGKRLRPSLVLAAGMTSIDGPVDERVIQGATAIELVHLGSLYHDDVLDGATTRRMVSSANARFGNFMAIIAGDYLLARASAIAAELGPQATALLAEAISELCEGQVWEQRYSYRLDRSVEAYNSSISGKTASLIAASTRMGALTAQLSAPAIKALSTFGHCFGMAFQIRDDVLDIIGTDEQLGKPSGNDLMEGVFTLPVIYALGQDSIQDQLHSLLNGDIEITKRDEALSLIRKSGAVEMAISTGQQWAKQASDALIDLEETSMTRYLTLISSSLFNGLEFA